MNENLNELQIKKNINGSNSSTRTTLDLLSTNSPSPPMTLRKNDDT